MAHEEWRHIRRPFRRCLTIALCLALLTASSPLALGPAPVTAVEPAEAEAASTRPLPAPLARAPRPLSARHANDLPEGVTHGTLLGRVVDATTEAGLGPVQVVAVGVIETLPLPVFLPFVYGSSTCPLDLRMATASVGSPETGVISAAVARLARYYSLPCNWVWLRF